MKVFADIEKQLNDLEYNSINTNKKKTFIDISCSFDIETSSVILADGEKSAFMYVWTMAIDNDDLVFHGRTWEDFIEVCEELQNIFRLDEDRILTCYIHNLSYEFQFMRKHFDWVNVFSIDERKPIKALCSYGIEFKDSYILSGFSLSNLANNLMSHDIEKLEGDLNYDLVRHTTTELTDEEKQYCINDVVIIIYYIDEQREQYGDITKIPLTNTGRVREFVKHNCYYTNTNHRKSSGGKFQRYRRIMSDLVLKPEEYDILKRAFMGGFTHANAEYSGKLLNDVTSIDFASAYPSVMLAEKFPMSKPIKTTITSRKQFDEYREKYCLVFDIQFKDLCNTFIHENYISESKCQQLENPVLNNGRVFSADYLTTTITDVDFRILENTYTWDSFKLMNVYRFHKGYLPKDIIKSVISLYADKTELKDVKGKEVEYVVSKGMLNSTYGMCVTDIIRDEIIYNEDWDLELADKDEQIHDYNQSYNRFLYYAWGVWITAYARENLWSGIVNMGGDYVYSDTDSIKFKNYDKYKPYIKAYNDLLGEKLKFMCNHYDLEYSSLEPKTVENVTKPLGVWELDGEYKRFKTLGAKRYLVEFENGEMESTVAGLSKANGLEYMKRICKNDNDKVFEMFNDELYIPSEETGKMTHTYIDYEFDYKIKDYNGVDGQVKSLSSIHLEKCDFTLSVNKMYLDFIEKMFRGEIYSGVTNN